MPAPSLDAITGFEQKLIVGVADLAVSSNPTVMITTYPGTYFRWEAAPGKLHITGYGSDIGMITLQTEPGKLYFVQQRLAPFMRFPHSQFYLVNEPYGRAAVSRAVLIGGS